MFLTYKTLNSVPTADSHEASVSYVLVYEEPQEGEAVCDTSGADSTDVLCTAHGGNLKMTFLQTCYKCRLCMTAMYTIVMQS